ncbi:MAG: hypothetical protein KGI50_03895 [Patescibacteria group bacterium]|nr:hypothetical protein [Patescibacteria group bacterium]MDE2438429.1 hypothetical protein [Patescibacteria group bacterium]
MAETKIAHAHTFDELYTLLRDINVLTTKDGTRYTSNALIESIENARKQLRTFNVSEKKTVLTQQEFQNNPKYPLRDIPEIYGLRTVVSILLQRE